MAELNGARRTTDLPLTYSDIAQLGLEAAARNISMGQLLTDIMCNAIKKKMFDEISKRAFPRTRFESRRRVTALGAHGKHLAWPDRVV